MSEITKPANVTQVQWQEEKPRDEQHRGEHAPNKVAETYEESAYAFNDKITILGIPIDLMTTQVQATIGGLVAEVDHLKTKVKRYEGGQGGKAAAPTSALLTGEQYIAALDQALSEPPPHGMHRQLALIVVNTYEDIRKSSGVLAANSALADVVMEITNAGLSVTPVGIVGGPTIGALLTEPDVMEPKNPKPSKPEDPPPLTTADKVRAAVDQKTYTVSGIDMHLSFTVAAVRVVTGQSALQAIGQVDHVLRS
ncbi:MAG: hypothetical protein RIC29_14715 [Rhodospirillaceae bacterium]